MQQFRLVVLVLSLLPWHVAAQEPQGEIDLSGQVVNAVSGEPVVHAMVQCTAHRQINPVAAREAKTREEIEALFLKLPKPVFTTVFTDGTGSFRCAGLFAGNGSVQVTKPQFEGASENFELSGPKEGLRMKLLPLSAIDGVVKDEDGVPLSGIQMILYQSIVEDGRRIARQYHSQITDEFGHYRFWDLRPAKYLVRAAGRYASGETRAEYMATTAAAESPLAVYFGGARNRGSALLLDLHSGENIPADFKLVTAASHRVIGQIAGKAPNQPLKFELMDEEGEVWSTKSSVNSVTGRFILFDALPGKYRLRVTQDSSPDKLFGSAPLEIKGSDVTDVRIQMRKGVEIPLRIQCAASTPAPEQPVQVVRGISEGFRNRAICNANVVLRDGNGTVVHSNGGQKSILNVEPGKYELSVTPFQSKVTSVQWQGHELVPGTGIDVPAEGAAVGIEIQLGSEEHGTLNIRSSIPDLQENVHLIAIPPVLSLTPPPGGFLMKDREVPMGLPPGDYTIYAYPMASPPEYRNPEVLRTLRGVAVHVTAGKTEQVEIRSLCQ